MNKPAKIFVTLSLLLIAAATLFALVNKTRSIVAERKTRSDTMPTLEVVSTENVAAQEVATDNPVELQSPKEEAEESSDAAAVPKTSKRRYPEEAKSPVALEGYTMTERSGEEFSFAALKGKVWIANMFFASCPHQCRDLNLAMKAIALDKKFTDVEFVSVTCDPDTDTPEVLKNYASLFDADKAAWSFVTADMKVVEKFGQEALNVPVAKQVHTDRLVVFDREGRRRGAFRFSEPAEMSKLRKLVPLLLADPPSASAENAELETAGDDA